MKNPAWIKVSKKHPCPICKKPDWCCVGERYVNCMRVMSPKVCANGGYLHPVDGAEERPRVQPMPVIEEPKVNCTALWYEWSHYTPASKVAELAAALNVAPAALKSLGVAWTGERYAFPMRDEWEEIIGIQFRQLDGFKLTMRGSKVGYFIPKMTVLRTVFVCEGASDTAAALSMGLCAVGKYNCTQGGAGLGKWLRRNRVQEVVICADNDHAGEEGADKLAKELNLPYVVYTPPAKDLRAAIAVGLTRAVVESTVGCLNWQ